MSLQLSLEQFEALARARRATRHFQPSPVPDGLLERLLKTAQWAPSGYNLQPSHFFIIRDASIRPALKKACFGQTQITEAPAIVVFAGDRRAWERNFEETLQRDISAGAVDDKYAAFLRKIMPLMFRRGPLGLNWLWKALLPRFLTLVMPVPEFPAVHAKLWLARQVSLCAMTFMLAAQAAGLSTSPMEGFDARRLRKALGISRDFIPILVVPVGYGLDSCLIKTKTRLPAERVIHPLSGTA